MLKKHHNFEDLLLEFYEMHREKKNALEHNKSWAISADSWVMSFLVIVK
jgi:hypothetical protein